MSKFDDIDYACDRLARAAKTAPSVINTLATSNDQVALAIPATKSTKVESNGAA